MNEYDVDAPVNTVVDWIRAERARKWPRLVIRASKEYRAEPGFDRNAFGVGDEDDVALASVRGLLEVQSRTGRKDWTLQLKVEDPLGLRWPGDEEAYEDEESMAFEAFDEQFLATGLGEVEMTVRAESPEAKARFDRWLARALGPRRG
jgi:hypothetical protein